MTKFYFIGRNRTCNFHQIYTCLILTAAQKAAFFFFIALGPGGLVTAPRLRLGLTSGFNRKMPG